ncbi:MAG: hypothetical protein ACI89X_004167 [Planctomycetota bacterium]|jgi:hypothetical protein
MTSKTHRSLSCLALALVCSAPVAQDRKFAPRDFMILNYENLMFADIKAMRGCEIWDELESSVMKKVVKEVDGTDLVLRLDLGRVRNAVGHFATLALPMFADGEARARETAKDSPREPVKKTETETGKR